MSTSADERIAIEIVNDLNERNLAPAKLARWLLQHIVDGDMKAEDWIALAKNSPAAEAPAGNE